MVKKFHSLNLFLSLLILFFFVGINQIAFAQTFNVYSTQELRQALQDSTINGQNDVIMLADGTYKTTDDGGGTFTFLDNENYDLTIQGSSPDNVVLSGDNTDQVLNFNVVNFEQTIYLNNISVINGNSTGKGGGIYSQEGLDIKNCIISGNTSSFLGGGFYSHAATITDSTISDNTANMGAGLYAIGTINVKNSTISNNSASYKGGGIDVRAAITVMNSTISNNTAKMGGGGIYVYGDDLVILDSIISKNSAGQDSLAGSHCGGGGVRSENSDVTIIRSTITGNTNIANARGGGLYIGGNATITNSTISNNTSYSANYYNGMYGGGLYILGNATMTNSIITGNEAFQGGGLSCSNATITNSIITGNKADIGGGLYVFFAGGATNKILNSIFLNNGTNDINGVSNATVTVYNNYIDESKVGMPAFFLNNIFIGNLDFIDQANGNFHLGENSVLIDAGTTTVDGITFPAADLDGNTRIAGSSIDIGPYEYSGTGILNTYYYDNDGDGYGNPNNSKATTVKPNGFVADNTDCNDNDSSINPGATEIIGDGIDQDCNGSDSTSAPNTITMEADLSFTFPDAIYKSLTGDMSLWADFKFFGEQSGKSLWELENYGATVSVGNPITIKSDLSFSFDATYSFLFGKDMDLTLNFKFFGEQNAKMLWELESYTVK